MSIEDKVCEFVQERKQLGLAKYGTNMERTDLSQKEWLQHAQEEALDLAVYLEKLKQEACVLSKDDKQFLLAIVIHVKELELFSSPEALPKLCEIEQKLQEALNLV